MIKKPYIIALFFFLFDLITKQIVIHFLNYQESIIVIPHFFALTYTKNTGAAWSILKDEKMLLLIITVLVLYLFIRMLNHEKLLARETFVYGMIMGGILGNFFDRIVNDGVIDFLDFTIFGYDYPIFNFADIFIVVGIIWLIIVNIKKEYYERNNCRGK